MKAKFLAVLVLVLQLSACSGGVADLMRPPKLPDDFQRVRDVLDREVTSGYHLIYTLRGDDTSAVRFVDLSGDGMMEAVAFYKQSGASDVVSVHVMSQEYGDWQTIADFSMPGIDIDKLDFRNFQGDPKLEMVIGRRTTDMGGNLLSVYTFYPEVKEIYTSDYIDFLSADVDNADTDELFYITALHEKNAVEGHLVGNDANGYHLLSSVRMDAGVTSYRSVNAGDWAKGKTAIFVDGIKGKSSGVTEILLYENGVLKNPFFSAAENATTETTNQFSIISRDINDDGIIEIPIIDRFAGNEEVPLPSAVWSIRWCAYAGDYELETRAVQMYNPVFDYSVALPAKWQGKVAAQMSDDGTVIRICPINDASITVCEIISGSRMALFNKTESSNRELFSQGDTVIEISPKTVPAKYANLLVTDEDIANMKVFFALSADID